MPRRTAKFAPLLFVSILAGVPFAKMAHSEPAAVEDCLSSPKGETPPGSHWYYRVDHTNKRNCWYLRPEGGAVSQAVPQNSRPAQSPSAKASIADAHAELRSRPAYDDSSAVNPPPNPAVNDAASANGSVWNRPAAVATRWPDLPAASTMAKATPALASPATNVDQPSDDQPQAATPAAATANFSYLPIRPETIRTLIAATIGALAFAVAAALISRRGRTRRLRRRQARFTRGPIWQTTDDDRIVLSDHASAANRNYQPRFARNVEGAALSLDRTPEFARHRVRPAPR